MPAIGKAIMLFGVLLFLIGLVMRLAPGKLSWLGHLPGDLRIGDSVYIPIMSCLVVSAVLTILLNVLGRFFK